MNVMKALTLDFIVSNLQILWKILWDQGAYFHVHSFNVRSVSKKEYCSVWRGFLHSTRERRSSRSCCLRSLSDASGHNRSCVIQRILTDNTDHIRNHTELGFPNRVCGDIVCGGCETVMEKSVTCRDKHHDMEWNVILLKILNPFILYHLSFIHLRITTWTCLKKKKKHLDKSSAETTWTNPFSSVSCVTFEASLQLKHKCC